VATVSDIFAQLGLTKWWTIPTQTFGENGEKGTDFGTSAGANIGAITGGRVIYVGNGGYPGSSIGQIVQVLSSDGKLYHYQHLKTSNVSVGQTVQVGSVIGTGGGCPVGAYSGSGCSWTDQYTTGPHLEVRIASSYVPSQGVWSQAWYNPLSSFLSLAGGGAATVAGGSSSSSTSGTPDWQAQIQREGIKIGLFLVALVLVGFGLYLLFQKQANGLAKTAVKAALL